MEDFFYDEEHPTDDSVYNEPEFLAALDDLRQHIRKCNKCTKCKHKPIHFCDTRYASMNLAASAEMPYCKDSKILKEYGPAPTKNTL